MSTLHSRNVDISKIRFADVKTTDSGGKTAYINYGTEPLYIQTPALKTAFTMSKYGADKDKPLEIIPDVVEKYGLQLNLGTAEVNKSVQSFFKLIKDIDNKVINAGTENSKKWFGKEQGVEVVKEFYSSCLIYYKDKDTGEISDKYAPTFRLNIPVVNGKIKTDCYDEDGNPFDVPFPIERGTKVTAILQVSSIWFVGKNKFGVSFRPVSLKVVPNVTNFKSFAFKDDPDDNDEASDEQEHKIEVVDENKIESSDDDEVEPEATEPEVAEPEPEPEPVVAEPKVVKRVVKKKA